MDMDNLSQNEMIPYFDIEGEFINKFPSLWQDKPKVIGLIKSLLTSLQPVADDIKGWADTYTISNAIGTCLDDIAYMYNVDRAGVSDEELRTILFSTFTTATNNGTAPEVINFANALASKVEDSGELSSDIFQYTNMRYCVLHTRGGVLSNYSNNALLKAVSSGCAVTPVWSGYERTFIPAVLTVASPLIPIDAIPNTGIATELLATLNTGFTDYLATTTPTSNEYYYEGDKSIATLPPVGISEYLEDHEGNPITILGSYAVNKIELLGASSSATLFLAVVAEGTTL